MDRSAFGATVGISAGVLALGYLAVWRLAIRRRDVSLVDILWGTALVLVAVVSSYVGRGSATLRTLLLLLTGVWGVRLSSYLAWRNLGAGEDPRYTAMREKVGASFDRWALVNVFGAQWLGALFVSLPVMVGANLDAGVRPWTWIGVALWAVGLGFETIGDAQLAAFKRGPANRGRVMDRGLWRYTRHPNYFGDACVWWGIYLVAAADGLGALSILSPIVMTYLLVRVTGKRLLEHRLTRSRPGYAEYIEHTSGFLPWRPRRRRDPSLSGEAPSLTSQN